MTRKPRFDPAEGVSGVSGAAAGGTPVNPPPTGVDRVDVAEGVSGVSGAAAGGTPDSSMEGVARIDRGEGPMRVPGAAAITNGRRR